jgi:Fur family zinc uptake transcriptional regulator
LRAPLQVYRALEKLTERGLAHRLESVNAFVCCANAHCHESGSTAFAICDKCGRVEEFAERAVEHKLMGWSKSAGFTPSRMTIELRGICRDCSGAFPGKV